MQNLNMLVAHRLVRLAKSGLLKGIPANIFKSQPTPSDVHVNVPLANISIAYIQEEKSFIAAQVFPVVPVEQQTNVYYTFNKGDFWRDEARPRAPGTESAGSGWTPSTASYACIVESFHKDVDDQTRANTDSVLAGDKVATILVTQKLLIRRERRWVTNFFGTGIWATDVTGVASAPSTGQFLQWDVSTSTPATDVDAGKIKIRSATGMTPNTLVIDYQTYLKLRSNPDIKKQFNYTSDKSVDIDMMTQYFGVDRLLVSMAVYTSGNEGATQTTGFIAGKGALLCYVNPSPALMMPSAGYTFAWSGYIGAGAFGVRFSKFRIEAIKSDRIEGEMAFDQKVVATDCGYFLSGTIG